MPSICSSIILGSNYISFQGLLLQNTSSRVVYCFSVLKATSLKSRWWQGYLPSETYRRILPCLPTSDALLEISGIFWHIAAWLQSSLGIFSVFTWLSSYKDTSHVGRTACVLHMCVCALSHSVMSDSLWPRGLQPTRLLCPWGFSRQEYWSEKKKKKNAGVGCHALLQRIFPTQVSQIAGRVFTT